MRDSFVGDIAGLHVHGFATVEDRHGRRWRAGRAFVWLSRAAKQHTDDKSSLNASLEWTVLPSRLVHCLGFKVSTRGEETLDVHLYLGPLANLYFHLDLNWRGRLVRLRPRVRTVIQVRLTSIDWCFGPDDGSWARNASWADRLRRNRLHWLRLHWHRRSVEQLSEVTAVVPLPEGNTPVTVMLERGVWGVELGPYRRTRSSKRTFRCWLPGPRRIHWTATVNATAAGGLPVPGKGENSWDCGPDAIRQSTVRVRSPHGGTVEPGRPGAWTAEAIGQVVESTLRTRIRYGHGITDTGRSETSA